MESELTFLEHLEELRGRIIVSLVWLLVATLASLPFSSELLKILKSPAAGTIEKLAFFSPQEAFLIYMRVGFLSGLCLAFPVISYQFWAFVSPAIDERFKKGISYFVVSCSATFIIGCLFAYFILLPRALRFLLSFGTDDLEPVISAARYISFVTSIILCCGVVFQMPVLSYLLTRTGLVNAGILRKRFGVAIVVISVIAAVITPTTDIFNMMLLAVPMVFLYEVSIWVSALAGRGRG